MQPTLSSGGTTGIVGQQNYPQNPVALNYQLSQSQAQQPNPQNPQSMSGHIPLQSQSSSGSLGGPPAQPVGGQINIARLISQVVSEQLNAQFSVLADKINSSRLSHLQGIHTHHLQTHPAPLSPTSTAAASATNTNGTATAQATPAATGALSATGAPRDTTTGQTVALGTTSSQDKSQQPPSASGMGEGEKSTAGLGFALASIELPLLETHQTLGEQLEMLLNRSKEMEEENIQLRKSLKDRERQAEESKRAQEQMDVS